MKCAEKTLRKVKAFLLDPPPDMHSPHTLPFSEDLLSALWLQLLLVLAEHTVMSRASACWV